MDEGVWERLQTIFYPKRCVFCGVCITEKDYCEGCSGSVVYCGADEEENYVTDVSLIERIVGVMEYNGITKKGVIGLKFHKRTFVVKAFVKMLEKRYEEVFSTIPIDVIVPVPLHSFRFHKRGFNQSDELGKPLAKRVAVAYRTDLLRRIRNTQAQSSLKSKEERMHNLIDAFDCKNQDFLQGKNVLIIDDVCTTGSTLKECAKELKKSGAKKVYALTILKTPKK